MSQPLVLVAPDVRAFQGYDWHAAPDSYLTALVENAGVTPVVVPAFGERLDLEGLIARADGVLMTGSRSNVHPTLYGKPATEKDEPFDPARDSTTLPLIRLSIDRGVPLLCICRGLQELNVALGGTLATEIQEEEGRMDHRAPESELQEIRFAIRHPVRLAGGGCLGRILDADSVEVNSLHRQAVGALADRLQVEAMAEDGTIEAVSVKDAPGFTLGVQWHPEYWARTDRPSARIFEAFGDATRAYAARRAGR